MFLDLYVVSKLFSNEAFKKSESISHKYIWIKRDITNVISWLIFLLICQKHSYYNFNKSQKFFDNHMSSSPYAFIPMQW